MKSKAELRAIVKRNLPEIVLEMNVALTGKNLQEAKGVLRRIGRNEELPHWYKKLRSSGSLPNLDGKTVGSVVEMLLVAVLETKFLQGEGIQLRINPARGIDLPDLDLGVKSPSRNYCTSEPFFSPYQRLYGSDHDVAVLLTNYQTAKKKRPLKLELIQAVYLEGSELADKGLCEIALKYRKMLLAKDEVLAQKFFQFLAYVNQSDWLGRQLLKCVVCFEEPAKLEGIIATATRDFVKKNKELLQESDLPLSEEDLTEVRNLRDASPTSLGLSFALDRWVTRTFPEAARLPNGNEWERLKNGPLNGKIGISPALQWRYNFKTVFTGERVPDERKDDDCLSEPEREI